MKILINNQSGQPIYDQISSQLRDQIIQGDLSEDESLPGIRTLAKDLRISVITTKRAYEELEREGYIYTVPGKGSFVAKRNESLIREEYLRRIEEHLEEVYRLAGLLHLSEDELKKIADTIREADDERS
ncbi:MAG: GntR family transcriptional regulator [Erysipelotrichaceae bacterium]|nr:GntR family transcriptional regulator [Erysipelotrichaceae bacterium]